MKPVQISVIIPTCHRNDLLAKCLDCLAPGVQTLPADRYEVIVTDDGSRSTAEAMVTEHYPWAQWVAGPRKGPAANRNNGARRAQGDWLAFTDDDCLPDPNWLSVFSEAMTGEVRALEGAIHPLGDMNQDMADCPVNLDGGHFWSANIAVARILFDSIGGFDPSYSLAAHEDQDLKLRVLPLTQIRFIPQAIVRHPVRFIDTMQRLRQLPARCRAWAYHARKHRLELGFRTVAQLLKEQYKFHLVHLKRHIIGRRFHDALISTMMLLYGIPLIIASFQKLDSRSGIR